MISFIQMLHGPNGQGGAEMENITGSNSCMCEGREFASSEKVCQKTACYICKDGNWEEDDRIPVL